MQKLTGWLGDNFGGLDGPIVGRGGNILPRTFTSPQLVYGDYGKWSFFFLLRREVLKAPPAAMDAFDEEKHHAVITLSLWTAFEY